MTTDEEHKLKRRYKEFIDLMPLTIAIAGLPENPGPRSYGTDQMEARAQVLQSALPSSLLQTPVNCLWLCLH